MIKKRTLGVKFLAFFIGFFLTCVLLFFVIYVGAVRALDGKQIKKGIKQMDIANIELDGETVAFRVHQFVTDDYGEALGYGNITVEQIEEVLEIKEIKGLAADKIADCVDCLIDGEGVVTISEDEVADVVEGSADEIYEITGIQIGSRDLNKIRESFKGQEKVILDSEDIFKNSSADVDAVRDVVGGKYIIFFVISISIMLGMFVAINIKRYKPYLLTDIGFPMIFAGLLANLFANGIPELLPELLPEDSDAILGVMMGFVNYIMSCITFFANIIIVLGALLLGIFFALKFIDKSKIGSY